jgi:ABC-type uncharacterized transport system YnjBCD substrate-binding protein
MAATLDDVIALVTKNNAQMNQRLDAIGFQLATLTAQGDIQMSALDDLTTQVASNTSVEQSAIVLIQGLAAQIAATANDPAKLAALTAQLNSSATALAAAITANTPAAPPAPGPSGPAAPAGMRR